MTTAKNRGETHPFATLSEADVANAKRLAMEAETVVSLAPGERERICSEVPGLTPNLLLQIMQGVSWKHTDPSTVGD